jgi:TetR/AcrR family transcriptional regulator, transcriptional repressor for nem operon
VARPREFDEATVLAAARDVFWSTGYAGTSLDDLTTATGLANSSLYSSFGSKRELFVRVFDEYCGRAGASVVAALAGPDEGAMDRIAAYLRRSATQTAKDTGRRGCLWAKGAAELSEHDPAIAKRSRETVELMETQLARALNQAQRAGDATDRASAKALARTVLAALRGIEALGKAGASRQALRDIAETTITLIASAPGSIGRGTA